MLYLGIFSSFVRNRFLFVIFEFLLEKSNRKRTVASRRLDFQSSLVIGMNAAKADSADYERGAHFGRSALGFIWRVQLRPGGGKYRSTVCCIRRAAPRRPVPSRPVISPRDTAQRAASHRQKKARGGSPVSRPILGTNFLTFSTRVSGHTVINFRLSRSERALPSRV